MTAAIILIGFYLVILLYSVIIHEVSHGVAALWLGDKTAKYADRLNLNPVKHADPFGSLILPLILFLSHSPFIFGWAKPVPYNPYNLRNQKWGPLLVALAGPASNILLASGAALIAQLITIPSQLKVDIISRLGNVVYGEEALLDRYELLADALSGSLGSIFFGIMLFIILWNVILACFNLIPIPPLDGSKLLYVILPLKEQTKFFLEQYGIFILLIAIFILQIPIGAFISPVLNFFIRLTV